MKKILYVRSGPYQLDLDSYNIQEIGLASAFADKGVICDILFYHQKENYDQVIEHNGNLINIFWRKGIRILRSGIYPQLMKKDFLMKYDAVIISEYSQIMSVIISNIHPNVYIYNGPYYNLFKIPITEKIYDRLFSKLLNRKVKHIFCKTRMAQNFLKEKGLTNTSVVGVGLDTNTFSKDVIIKTETKNLLEKMSHHRILLYVGSISKRKNVELIIRTFNILKLDPQNKDLKLYLIGSDEGGYLQKCRRIIEKQSLDSIVSVSNISNSQLSFLYNRAEIFLLPSKQEIFGMVLLEAMYFGLPVVSSANAGAKTLITSGQNGYIVDSFDEKDWVKHIQLLLSNQKVSEKMGEFASKSVKENYLWNHIVSKMISKINIE